MIKIGQVATVYAVNLYITNRSPYQLAEELFPDEHPDYWSDWAVRFQCSRGSHHSAMGAMDRSTLRRFVYNAMEAYGDEALHYVTTS